MQGDGDNEPKVEEDFDVRPVAACAAKDVNNPPDTDTRKKEFSHADGSISDASTTTTERLTSSSGPEDTTTEAETFVRESSGQNCKERETELDSKSTAPSTLPSPFVEHNYRSWLPSVWTDLYEQDAELYFYHYQLRASVLGWDAYDWDDFRKKHPYDMECLNAYSKHWAVHGAPTSPLPQLGEPLLEGGRATAEWFTGAGVEVSADNTSSNDNVGKPTAQQNASKPDSPETSGNMGADDRLPEVLLGGPCLPASCTGRSSTEDSTSLDVGGQATLESGQHVEGYSSSTKLQGCLESKEPATEPSTDNAMNSTDDELANAAWISLDLDTFVVSAPCITGEPQAAQAVNSGNGAQRACSGMACSALRVSVKVCHVAMQCVTRG